MNKKERFYIEADYRELVNPDYLKHIKNMLANKIGTEIIEKTNLDINNFEEEKNICIQIELRNRDNPEWHKKELRADIYIREVREIEQVYITRKDEINTMSKFYTGEKLTWKERVQALFKGRLYGGRLISKEKKCEK